MLFRSFFLRTTVPILSALFRELQTVQTVIPYLLIDLEFAMVRVSRPITMLAGVDDRKVMTQCFFFSLISADHNGNGELWHNSLLVLFVVSRFIYKPFQCPPNFDFLFSINSTPSTQNKHNQLINSFNIIPTCQNSTTSIK